MNKKTILVVDPDESFRETLDEILTDEGYKVISVASGEEALKLVASESIGLVLMEIFFPDMDVFTIFDEIKKIRKDLSVIIVSGHANIDTAFMAAKKGFYDILEKPVSLDKLLIMIKRAFNKKMRTKMDQNRGS